MKLYSNSGLINSQQIILSPSVIIQSTSSEDINRRNFILLSAFSMGMMIYPTKSEAYLGVLGKMLVKAFINFGVTNKRGKGAAIIINEMTSPLKLNDTEVMVTQDFLNNKNKEQKAEKLQTELIRKTGLSISKGGVSTVLKHMRNDISFHQTVWDKNGIAENKRGEVFMNQAEIQIKNKTSHYIERKIRLIILSEYGNKEFAKQFTLKAGADESGTFDVSEYFRELPKIGIKSIGYDILGGFNDVSITSSSKNILVTKLIR